MTEAQSRSGRLQIQQTATVTKIHADLMQAIREGVYLPGSQLPNERQLAERYAASRQQVRDALLILNEMGLIARKVGSGTWLSGDAPQIIERLDAGADLQSALEHSLQETIEARLILEPGVAALAARNITPARLAELKTTLVRVGQPANWREFKSRTYLFARAYYEASGNSFLLWTFDQILKARADHRVDNHRESSAVAEIVRRHCFEQLGKIYRAIADGDEARAEEVTKAYLVSIAASSGLG